MAHYMPWFQTPEVRGYWGWHWTMDHFNPSTTGENGRPEIASHYMPLTGPYDSSDDALLEYQVGLMKLSGIDGVIVDWYGMENFRDYAALNESTGKLFEYIKQAGLLFAICYEDQTIKHMVDGGYLSAEGAIPHGQEVMQYIHEHWFSDDVYLKYDDQPVLFVFGPQYFRSSTDWEALFSVLDNSPALVTLDKHLVSNALASYPWVPGFGIEINKEVVEAHLGQFYRIARRYDYVVGGAFPGFHDIYAEANVQSSYGFLDAQDGEILRFTLQLALKQNPDVIQLITWNDYGEGTMIEPAEEYGYQYLEIVQEIRREMSDSDFPFSSEDLRLPLEIFRHRKAGNETGILDEAFASLLNGNLAHSRQLIADLPTVEE
ncbi:MAG: glycoside hydrolase family 71/99-like protein [Chloroflexi bacterium]|nr:glycoside hydrolase family 71/99-like protein [Chloroflexota bacterium]